VRWILVVLLMCNGIYFLWQYYLVPAVDNGESAVAVVRGSGARLVLLSERESLNNDGQHISQIQHDLVLKADERAVSTEPLTTDTAEGSNICWLIGPFNEEVSGKQVVGRLAAMDITLRLQTVEVPGKPDYWVYIKPQDTRKRAISLLRELQAKKIDSYVITQGELADGISLGFFTQKDRADAVYKARIKDGYEPIIKVVPRTHKEIWAVFDRGEHGKMSEVLWQKIKEGNKGLERRKNYCDKIASMGNFE